jgi:hypothetical protein
MKKFEAQTHPSRQTLSSCISRQPITRNALEITDSMYVGHVVLWVAVVTEFDMAD